MTNQQIKDAIREWEENDKPVQRKEWRGYQLHSDDQLRLPEPTSIRPFQGKIK